MPAFEPTISYRIRHAPNKESGGTLDLQRIYDLSEDERKSLEALGASHELRQGDYEASCFGNLYIGYDNTRHERTAAETTKSSLEKARKRRRKN